MADKSPPQTAPWLVPVALVVGHMLVAWLSAMPTIHTGGDNAAYISLARSLAADGAYVEEWHPGAPPHTKYPPLYPALMALMILMGAKAWGTFKAASVVFTGLAVAACYLWVRKARGPQAALAVATLFAVAPAVLFSAQWILSDPLFLFLTLAGLWLLTPGRDAPIHLLLLGAAAAMAAYFTRSAGLPLVVAVAVWLALQKRWKLLGVFAGVFAVPGLLWQQRAGTDYVSEFWLVQPYVPDLGRAGPVDLLQRVAENLWTYSTDHVPTGLTGLEGVPAGVLGVVLTALAAAGWIRRVRAGPGVSEIFFLLYAALVLAWPAVWSGDRFALPLFPLLLLYAGESLALAFQGWRRAQHDHETEGSKGRSPWPARAVFVAVAATFLIPAGLSWQRRAGVAAQCRPVVTTVGPMGCTLRTVSQYQTMALWAAKNLHEESIVFSRKPRIFHVFSGLQSVTFPLTNDGRSLLSQADSLNVEYLVYGNWDNTGPLYVDPVLRASPHRFCVLVQLGYAGERPISMLAILPPASDDASVRGEEPAAVPPCPGDLDHVRPSAAEISSMTVPILDR